LHSVYQRLSGNGGIIAPERDSLHDLHILVAQVRNGCPEPFHPVRFQLCLHKSGMLCTVVMASHNNITLPQARVKLSSSDQIKRLPHLIVEELGCVDIGQPNVLCNLGESFSSVLLSCDES